jgi:hypothetical protein
MWAAIVFLSDDRALKPFGRMTTYLLKWAFGQVFTAIFFAIPGGGVWKLQKR